MSTLDPISALSTTAALLAQAQLAVEDGLTYVPPPPPLDIIDYLVPTPGHFVRETFVRLLSDGRTAIYLPRPTGSHFPMDVKIVTPDGLYDRVTDFPGHWSDPAAFRLYSNPNPGSLQLGIKLAPRHYDPSSGRIAVADYTTSPITTQSYAAGAPISTATSHAHVYFELRPGINFGGTLGVQDPLVSLYYYNWSTALAKKLAKPQTLEEFFWVKGSSWAQWLISDLQLDGTYAIVPAKSVTYNTYIPDTQALPVLQYPVIL